MHSRPFILTIVNVPNYRFRTRMESVTQHIPIADARWLGTGSASFPLNRSATAFAPPASRPPRSRLYQSCDATHRGAEETLGEVRSTREFQGLAPDQAARSYDLSPSGVSSSHDAENMGNNLASNVSWVLTRDLAALVAPNLVYGLG